MWLLYHDAVDRLYDTCEPGFNTGSIKPIEVFIIVDEIWSVWLVICIPWSRLAKDQSYFCTLPYLA